MTVTIVPIVQGTTTTHDFISVTSGGRRMKISVEASNDITADAVREDLAASLAPGSKVHLSADTDPHILLAALGLWAVLAAVVFLLLVLCDLAGLHTMGYNAFTFPESWHGFFARQTIGTVLLRLHLILLAVILLIAVICAFWPGKKDVKA
ncbi:hypothetical protein [Pseudomonas sp. UMAB-40]|uniref:hypothetical protein n=1 Tax=Pseudomonas sp. UMAB-40 TaxID=1365407 RepID=UPI001C56CE8C|nr:hypothetical protein [Pseudomonas sp. UMAB-40]